MAARQAVEQIIDLRYTLCMLGVPIEGPSWLFGVEPLLFRKGKTSTDDMSPSEGNDKLV